MHYKCIFDLYYIILPRPATQSFLCCVSLHVTAGHTHNVRHWRTLQPFTRIGCRSVTYQKLESVNGMVHILSAATRVG